MNDESRLQELLSRWRERRQQGTELLPEELCKDCPELVGPVRERLQALSSMESFLEMPTVPPSEPRPDSAEVTQGWNEASPERQSPERQRRENVPTSPMPMVPGYEILAELGRGGMGVVYKARHVKLNRLVALKMILVGGHAGPDQLTRFRTEAEAVARLQHPNIVQIFEVGEHEGLPYFSLEFCAGGSLAAKLNGTPLPSKEAAQIVETLARAMHAAHQQHIIHRDLKPANILLQNSTTDRTDSTDKENGPSPSSVLSVLSVVNFVPKITDFGLAKKLDDVGQTQSGAVMGTPSYMAPEQAEGKTKDLGPATDTYALGAILYELLTGRPPFKGPTTMDTILQVVGNDPVPPTELQPKTPRDLETICLKCLQKHPGSRYASSLDLAEDLRRFQAGEPIAARPVGKIERSWRWCRRNPAVASLLGAVALTLILGTTVASLFALKAEANARESQKLAQEKDNLAANEKSQRIKAENLADANKQLALETDVRRERAELQALQAQFDHFYFRSKENPDVAMTRLHGFGKRHQASPLANLWSMMTLFRQWRSLPTVRLC